MSAVNLLGASAFGSIDAIIVSILISHLLNILFKIGHGRRRSAADAAEVIRIGRCVSDLPHLMIPTMPGPWPGADPLVEGRHHERMLRGLPECITPLRDEMDIIAVNAGSQQESLRQVHDSSGRNQSTRLKRKAKNFHEC